jgi:polar amino acid transport system ATP-binding protein
LRVDALTKRYGDRLVLDRISLDVADHEVVCLIGSSGSGKSTLLRCIDLLDPIDDGRILLDGDDITDRRTNANAVRRRIGIVFQSFNLFPHMSVLRNVTLGPRKVLGVGRHEADEQALALLERVGLAEKAATSPTGCPAGSSSAWRSCGRWRWNPSSCSSTRSPAPSIRSWSARCSTSSAG